MLSPETKVADPNEKPKNQEESPSPEGIPNLRNLLFSLPGAPTPEKVEEWKTEFGEVYVSGFSETEIFIFRPIFRGEYKTLQIEARKPQGEGPDAKTMSTHEYEEETCKVAVLWPTLQNVNKMKAGVITSLYEQIMQNSNFVPPQMAAVLVMKL
jgi:hypothetical protein